MRVLLEEVVLDFPDEIEAHAVGELDLLERVGDELSLAVVPPRARQLVLVEDAEAHGSADANGVRLQAFVRSLQAIFTRSERELQELRNGAHRCGSRRNEMAMFSLRAHPPAGAGCIGIGRPPIRKANPHARHP